MSQRYYIVDTRTVVGNCAMFWGPGRRGYVCNIDEAGKYSEDDARAQQRSRSTDVAIPCETIDALVIRHVRVDTDGFSGAIRMARERDPALPAPPPSKAPAVNCVDCGRFFTPTFPDDSLCRRCRQ
jgi:hypothetical protein